MTAQTVSSPMSFVGSTKRILSWAAGSIPKQITAWVALPPVWLFLVFWYIIVLGIFGIFTIPYRFIRRSQRKSNALAAAQLDEMRRLNERH